MTSAYSPRWSEPEKNSTQECDMPSCQQAGQFKAPKSRYSPVDKDYYRFCLDHVSEYNKQWNYFDGMSDMEVEIYWQDLDIDHRPTWKRERGKRFTTEALIDAFQKKFGGVFNHDAVEEMAARVPAPSREVDRALRQMDLEWPVTDAQVKEQFKILVKRYHPDVNQDPGAEDRFKQVTTAYTIVMKAITTPESSTS